jgi:hypothetical protein
MVKYLEQEAFCVCEIAARDTAQSVCLERKTWEEEKRVFIKVVYEQRNYRIFQIIRSREIPQ